MGRAEAPLCVRARMGGVVSLSSVSHSVGVWVALGILFALGARTSGRLKELIVTCKYALIFKYYFCIVERADELCKIKNEQKLKRLQPHF
jgi:hypothetical protein